MGRTVAEVTNKAKTIKHDIGNIVNNKIAAIQPPSEDEDENVWTQNQQKLLEMALKQFSKTTPERWDKIANCVPDKTKEQCIARYKVLAEKIIKAKKSKLKN